jgi:hypothetical protein
VAPLQRRVRTRRPTVRTSFRTSRRTSEEPSLPTWIAAALPSDVTIQYVDHGDNVGGQRVLTVCEAAARLARTT